MEKLKVIVLREDNENYIVTNIDLFSLGTFLKTLEKETNKHRFIVGFRKDFDIAITVCND